VRSNQGAPVTRKEIWKVHVGIGIIFQNPGKTRTDQEVYENELRLADLVEPLGFESVWTVEHHFTDYTMCPDPIQFLTWMAARTTTAKLGSMVVVLPWHDPMRVAEQVSMLDNMSGGRLILGMGRGAGRVEFDGFGIPMNESRERFVESAEMILKGLERGYCEYDGNYIKQCKAYIRPAPYKSFKNRTYAAAVSPESSRIMAELGVGLLIIPQKPWKEVDRELASYREIFRKVNDREAPSPILAGWTFCDEDARHAREMAKKYIGGYFHSVLEHYEFARKPLNDTKGYEYYGNIAEKIAQYGEDGFIEFFMDLQIFGTPDDCYKRIIQFTERTGANKFVGVFSYSGMPWEVSERNMRLFSEKVLPRLQASNKTTYKEHAVV